MPPKDTTPLNFAEKTFANNHKTSKVAKFSPSKVSYYDVHVVQLRQWSVGDWRLSELHMEKRLECLSYSTMKVLYYENIE